MLNNVAAAVAIRLPAYDPGLSPSDEGLPAGAIGWLKKFGGGVLMIAFIIAAVALVGAIIVWAIGTFGNQNQRMSSGGGKALVICAVAAIILGGVNGIVRWGGDAGEEIFGSQGQVVDVVATSSVDAGAA